VNRGRVQEEGGEARGMGEEGAKKGRRRDKERITGDLSH